MNKRTLANKYRPQKFSDVVGQEAEVEVLKRILANVWRPPALLFGGPYGTGKTSLARLISKALLCKNRQGNDPCGACESCESMESESHPNYTELDAASHGGVGEAREIKDLLEYRSTGELKIMVFDESHMLSADAQNALLEVLEEGRPGVMFMFATTRVVSVSGDKGKMLPTLRSRCIELDLRLLTANQIAERLRVVVREEGKTVDEAAIRIVATYVRGHLRDALMLMEQLLAMGTEVTEAMTRTYLRLDREVSIYEFLVLKDKKSQFEKLESLLCSFSAGELQELIGQCLLNAYKRTLKVGDFAEVDDAWLAKISATHGDSLLKKAEAVLSMDADFATINHAMAVFAKIFSEETVLEMSAPGEPSSMLPSFRKPKAG